MHVSIYVCMYVCKCMCMCVYVCMYVCMYVCVYIYIYIYVIHVCIYVYMCVYMCIHIYIYIIYIYIYIYIRRRQLSRPTPELLLKGGRGSIQSWQMFCSVHGTPLPHVGTTLFKREVTAAFQEPFARPLRSSRLTREGEPARFAPVARLLHGRPSTRSPVPL